MTHVSIIRKKLNYFKVKFKYVTKKKYQQWIVKLLRDSCKKEIVKGFKPLSKWS